MNNNYKIQCLIPDLPSLEEVLPFLEQMQENRWYSNFGPIVTRFEGEILSVLAEETVGTDGLHAVSLSSATAALELTLRAKRYPRGSQVLVPALTFPATALAVMNASLVPVMGDVEEGNWSLGPSQAKSALAQYPDLRAVVPVAAFGRPVDAGKWQQFQNDTGVDVVIDAAAALGQQVVTGGVDVAFSLHATKPFGVGEGGLLVTSDHELAERVRSLSNFGFSRQGSGEVLAVGTNAKMGEYYAAVALAQIKRFDAVMKRRRAVLDTYMALLGQLGNRIRLQDGTGEFVPAVFCIEAEGKAAAIGEALEQASTLHRRWYLPPLHQHAVFKDCPRVESVSGSGLPVSERCSNSLIGLPFHGFLSVDDVATICGVVSKIVDS